MATLNYNSIKPVNRIMIGIPVTGLVRIEWAVARYGQVIPCNWSQSDLLQFLDQFSPVQYTVADARNIIATEAVRQKFEWLFFIDHDVVLPNTTILKLNERMINNPVPVWSGLYFTKSVPSEPLVYRGIGNGYFSDWELGDDVWVSAVPMGCTMINVKLLEVLYHESEEYIINGYKVRRIFETPSRVLFDLETMSSGGFTGTEDINFCNRIINDNIFEKAGFPEYKEKEFPFLVDTSIFCTHIDQNGNQYPLYGEELRFLPKNLRNKRKDEIIDYLKNKFNMM